MHVHALFAVHISMDGSIPTVTGQVHYVQGHIIRLPPAAYTFTYDESISGYIVGTHVGLASTTSTFVHMGETWTIHFVDQALFSMHIDTTLQPYVETGTGSFVDKERHVTIDTRLNGASAHTITVSTPTHLLAPTTSTHDAALEATQRLEQHAHIHNIHGWPEQQYTMHIDGKTTWQNLSALLSNAYHVATLNTLTYNSSTNEVYEGDVVFAIDSNGVRVTAHLKVVEVLYTSVEKTLRFAESFASIVGMDVQLSKVVPQSYNAPGLSFVQVVGDDIPHAATSYAGDVTTASMSRFEVRNRQFDLYNSISTVSLSPSFTQNTSVRICTGILSEEMHTDPRVVVDSYTTTPTTPTPAPALSPSTLNSFTPDMWLNDADVDALSDFRWSLCSAVSLFDAVLDLQTVSVHDVQIPDTLITQSPLYFVPTAFQTGDPVTTHSYITSNGEVPGAWQETVPEGVTGFTSLQQLNGVNLMSIYEHVNVRTPLTKNLFVLYLSNQERTSNVSGVNVTGNDVVMLQRMSSVYRLTNGITHPLPAYQAHPEWLSPLDYNVVMIINYAETTYMPASPASTPTPSYTPTPTPTPTPSVMPIVESFTCTISFSGVSFPASLTDSDFVQLTISTSMAGQTTLHARVRCFPTISVDDVSVDVPASPNALLKINTYTTFLPGIESLQLSQPSGSEAYEFAFAAQTQLVSIGQVSGGTNLNISIIMRAVP